MRIGVNPLLWMNDDDPTLGADVPLERCLSEARAAGYAGIELGARFPRERRELAALLARHGLALVSGWWGSRLLERGASEEHEAMRAHLALLRGLGCRTLILAEVTGATHRDAAPLSRRPVLDRSGWTRFTSQLDALARLVADEEGLALAYHHHVGTVVETPEETERLIEETSSAVSLVLDTGHLALAAPDGGLGSVARTATRLASRIAHVHLKDVRGDVLASVRRRDVSFLDAVRSGVFTVPGDGALDLAAVTGALVRSGYAGWLVVEAEQDPERACPRTYARLGIEHVRRLLDGARKPVDRALRPIDARGLERRVPRERALPPRARRTPRASLRRARARGVR